MEWIHNLKKFIKCLFHGHDLRLVKSERFNVIRDRDNKKDGEVTLNLFTCKRCGKSILIPSDRTHNS